MKKLNQYLFQKRARKYLAQNIREKRYVDYRSAKTILLLFESDFIEKNRFIRKIIDQLTADGKKVFAWGFLNKKMTTTAILPSFKILDKSTIDFSECPKKTFITELTETKYDLLIDLTLNNTLPLQYVCLYANASLKAGINPALGNIFDLRIHLPLPTVSELDNTKAESEEKKEMEFLDLNQTLFHTDQQFIYEQIIFYLKKIQTKD